METKWADLSADERTEIENKLRAAAGSLGISEMSVEWKKPVSLPHWQVVIGLPSGISDKNRMLDQIIRRAEIDPPLSGVVLERG